MAHNKPKNLDWGNARAVPNVILRNCCETLCCGGSGGGSGDGEDATAEGTEVLVLMSGRD